MVLFVVLDDTVFPFAVAALDFEMLLLLLPLVTAFRFGWFGSLRGEIEVMRAR